MFIFNSTKLATSKKILFAVFPMLVFSQIAFTETPGEEAARVQRQLEEQRFEPVSPPEITINQYRYQMELEKRLRTQQLQIENMQKQVEQLKRSNRSDENE